MFERENRVEDRDKAVGSVMRLDCKEMAIYGVCPETDRFMAVICHYCGSVVKPQSLKEHIKRHAKDPSAASSFQEFWNNETICEEDSKLKRPMAVSLTSLKDTTDQLHPHSLEMRDPGNLYYFKGQKWNALLKNTENLQNVEQKVESRIESGSNSSSLDDAEVRNCGAVVCHFCGAVVKPHALQAHMNRHANDRVGDVSVTSIERKPRIEGKGIGVDESERLDSQLKPPKAATACMSSGFQQNTSPTKGTTALSHSDHVEGVDTLLQSQLGSAAKGARRGHGLRGRGKQIGKEREYDPDRHCGVSIDSGKPCTRTLTCKSHALSLRRQVPGRSVPFDKLLLDHRNSRAARSRNSASGVLPDADSSNSSSSFDIERKSLSATSSSNSSGGPTVGSPLRHTEELDGDLDHKLPIKLTDCSVTLNKLKREHTAIMGETSTKRLHLEKPLEMTELPKTLLDVQMECPPILDTTTLLTPDQQLTVAVPLSMISVMNLGSSVACSEGNVVNLNHSPPVHPESGLFTLSISNRARRDHNRLKLHVLRRSGVKTEENPSAESTPDPTEEFPDIDTWHSSIPRPCQVNSMKLRRIGGGSMLSRRFCNFRKALLANMNTNMISSSGQTILSSSTNIGTVASLLSGRSNVGSTSAKHTIYLDKVNFPGERIKV
uniref:Putative mucin-17-like protein n=1 Tax=Lutzomyia longipalpis TaxID=7200 RepID=A0A1B0CLN6_LUTLO